MVDAATLLDRIERLDAGDPLPGDDELFFVIADFAPRTYGDVAEDRAAIRTDGLACNNPVPPRLACELYDNRDTIKAALRYWVERHR